MWTLGDTLRQAGVPADAAEAQALQTQGVDRLRALKAAHRLPATVQWPAL